MLRREAVIVMLVALTGCGGRATGNGVGGNLGDARVECSDANVQTIQASDYDRSCSAQSDCIAVGEGNACYPCSIACVTTAVNIGAKSRYDADVANTGLQLPPDPCHCPMQASICCIGGLCRMDLQCP